jgi:hypothetical protein
LGVVARAGDCTCTLHYVRVRFATEKQSSNGRAARRRERVPHAGDSYFREAVNVLHASYGTRSVAPSRSVVSRTITPSADATSTHWPPLLPL